MGFNQRLVCALCLAAVTGAAFAKDFYWNCTTADGIKYADATQCDKGDTGVRVMKTGLAADAADSGTVTRNACQAVPAYCAQPDYGITDAWARTPAITHFMRQKECAFLRRFPPRCGTPD